MTTFQTQTLVPRRPTADTTIWRRFGFLELVIIIQVLAPAILYIPGTQPLRVIIRILPFAISLGGLIVLFTRTKHARPHPAWWLLIMALLYVGFSIFNPYTNTVKAGLGEFFLIASVMAPVFWVPYFIKDHKHVARLLVIVFVCNGINSAVGVLQVLDPDRFLPREYSTIIESQGGPLGYVTDDGRKIIRPPGLSDNPGAVCGPATSAALLGFIALTLRIKPWMKLVAVAFGGLGVSAILFSHVRTNILILFGMIIAYLLVLTLQKRIRDATVAVVIAGAVFAGAFAFALSIGGTAVAERFLSLVEDDPTAVYFRSGRGYMLQYDTAKYLAEHPFGAGLGRWGMMRYYFGDETNPDSPMLWAELQWPAWALDGGWVLLVLYQFAVIRAAWYEFTLLRQRQDRELASIAAVIFAANLGTFALIFGYTPFTNQVGLMYWMQCGMLHGLVLARQRARRLA